MRVVSRAVIIWKGCKVNEIISIIVQHGQLKNNIEEEKIDTS